MKNKSVKIGEIVIDGGTQQREKIDLAVVAEYADAMKCGAKFPSITVFFDGAQYWLADGFHRYWASRDAEFLDMLCDVHEGTNRDALLYSFGVNAAHGLRLTNADKRKIVMGMLADAEWVKWSDREIAKHCHVTNFLVSKIRNEILFGIKKEGRVLSANTLTPEAAPVNDLTFQKTPISEPIPGNPEADYDPKEDELSEAHSTIQTLAAENDALKDAIATGALPATEIKPAADTIAELRAQVSSLEKNLSAVTVARDAGMREIVQLKKQCAMQAKELKKLRK